MTRHTAESCREAALKYTTRAAFQRGDCNTYAAALSRGFLNYACAHMEPALESWTAEKVMERASKFATRGALQKGDPKAYHAARRMGLVEQACAHMVALNPPAPSDADLVALASHYPTRVALKRARPNVYGTIVRRGLLDVACGHMPSPPVRPTREEVTAAALGYASRGAFKRGNLPAYQAAQVYGMLGPDSEACAHMEKLRRKLSDEELTALAASYCTRSAFIKAEWSAYGTAARRGLLDTICAHMEESASCFKPAQPAVMYYLKVERPLETPLYKIGITNRSVQERFCRPADTGRITVLDEWRYATGAEAVVEERRILNSYAEDRYTGPALLQMGGNTELFTRDVLGLDRAA